MVNSFGARDGATGKTHRYYRCSRREKYGKDQCAGRPLPAAALEEFVVARISNATADGFAGRARREAPRDAHRRAGRGLLQASRGAGDEDRRVFGDRLEAHRGVGAPRRACA
ncbi:MAG: recombinase zinc beta ribbon domain-containing protein [Myxococcales bacterium]|nr:recombinase zinc beta ribbon domain-containing protein [Myxococcales bacterium]